MTKLSLVPEIAEHSGISFIECKTIVIQKNLNTTNHGKI